MKSLTAIIEQAEEGGYFAYCPEVKGANGQGETIEEMLQRPKTCYRTCPWRNERAIPEPEIKNYDTRSRDYLRLVT